jgi:hypothetical protein
VRAFGPHGAGGRPRQFGRVAADVWDVERHEAQNPRTASRFGGGTGMGIGGGASFRVGSRPVGGRVSS